MRTARTDIGSGGSPTRHPWIIAVALDRPNLLADYVVAMATEVSRRYLIKVNVGAVSGDHGFF